MKLLTAFFLALPEIVRLIKTIQSQAETRGEKARLKDEIKKINEAFEKKDADALNRLFAGDDK